MQNNNIVFGPVFDAALNAICSSNLTPFLVCKTEGLSLPPSLERFALDGRIVFNISGHAVRSLFKKNFCLHLDISDHMGVRSMVVVPFENVLSLFANEAPDTIVKFTHPPVDRQSPPQSYPINGNVYTLPLK